MEKQFRFQDFEIGQKAAAMSGELFSLADDMERRKLFRFAEQLRGATLSITNNIAEGSGSVSDFDFRSFLKMARRSVFEVANMLLIFSKQGYVTSDQTAPLLSHLEGESKQIIAFMRALR
jgi:four helix bundle protein